MLGQAATNNTTPDGKTQYHMALRLQRRQSFAVRGGLTAFRAEDAER